MKKQNAWSTKAEFVRGAFYVLLLIVIPFALAQQHVIRPTGVLGAHLVSIRPPVSPHEVIYDAPRPTTPPRLTPPPTAYRLAASNPGVAPVAFIDETDSPYQFTRGLPSRRLFGRSPL